MMKRHLKLPLELLDRLQQDSRWAEWVEEVICWITAFGIMFIGIFLAMQ